ncbi:MAG: hypothetical protein ACI8WB_003884 [Phenylobacterium sp.]|jgi:hypothetical protein
MKPLIIITLVLYMTATSPAQSTNTSTSTSTSTSEQDTAAISIFKQHQKVKALLAKHTDPQYTIHFSELQMSDRCGFVGCQWQKLVSMVITAADRANAPSVTFLGVVEGWVPDRGMAPTVRFVQLSDVDESAFDIQL